MIPKKVSLIKPPSPWQWLAGLAILILLVLLVESQIGWSKVLTAWQGLTPAYAGFVFICMAMSHLMRAYRIHLLLAENIPSRFSYTIKLSAIHQFFNNLLPMRVGEVAFPVLVKRYFGATIGQGVSQLIWLRVLDLIFMGTITFVVIALLNPMVWLLLPVCILAILLAGIWLYQHRKHRQALPPVFGKIRWLGSALQTLLANAPRAPALQSLLLLVTAAAWFFKLLAACTIITFFSGLPILPALSASIATELSGILPLHGIAGSGSYEAAFFAGASLSQGASTEWLGAAVNTHLFLLSCTIVVALLSLPIPVKKPISVANNDVN